MKLDPRKDEKAIADIYGIPAMNTLKLITGHMVEIRHYPATDTKPHRVYAVWNGSNGEMVRKRLRDPDTIPGLESPGWSNHSEFYAIEAGGLYCAWLTEQHAVTVGPRADFEAVLDSVAYAYEGARSDSHAIIVTWRDSRDLRPWQTDSGLARIREIESQFERISNDCNGNPRYWIHGLGFPDEFPWSDLGFRRYKGKEFGGGFTVSTYNLNSLATEMYEAERQAR